MKALLGFQDLTDVIENGIEIPKEGASDSQKIEFKDLKKKDCKALVILHNVSMILTLRKSQMLNPQRKHGTF